MIILIIKYKHDRIKMQYIVIQNRSYDYTQNNSICYKLFT